MQLNPERRATGGTGGAASSRDLQPAHLAHTLIELLVAIGILTVLATLYLTALSGAKAKGRQTQCANNLRQLGIALEQFVSDHRGYPFLAESVGRADGFPTAGWEDALGPYAGGYRLNTDRKPYQPAGLFHCPVANPPSCPTFPEGIVHVDYGYNAVGGSRLLDTNGSLGLSPWMGSSTNQPAPLPVAPFEINQPIRESQIANPAAMMAVGDGFTGNSQFLCDASPLLWRLVSARQDYPPGSTRRAHARHREKINVVHCDGHVETPRMQSLFGDENDGALRRWNRDNQPHRERLVP